jgi:hypothetical protein
LSWFVNPFAVEQRVLHTTVTAEECGRQLAARLNAWRSGMVPIGQERWVSGTVSAQDFVLKKVITYRNSWQTEARGRFAPMLSGTRIVVHLGISRWVAVFDLVALVFACLCFLSVGSALVYAWHVPEPTSHSDSPWVGLLLLLSFGAFIVGMRHLGRWLARSEADFLVQFLREVLVAEDVTNP